MIGSDDLNLDEFKNKIEYLKEQPFYEIFYKHSQVSENYETSLSSLATYVDTVLQVDTVEAFNRNYKESVTYINLQSLCDQHNVDLQLYYNWYGTHNATDEVKAIRKSVNILKKRAQFLVKKMLKSLFPPTVVLPSPPKSKSKTSPTKKSDKDGDSFQDYTSDDEVSEVSSEFFQGLRIGQDVVSFNTPVRFDIADVIDPSSKVPDSEFVEPSTNRFSKRNNG